MKQSRKKCINIKTKVNDVTIFGVNNEYRRKRQETIKDNQVFSLSTYIVSG